MHPKGNRVSFVPFNILFLLASNSQADSREKQMVACCSTTEEVLPLCWR